jgi:hypothetical protein
MIIFCIWLRSCFSDHSNTAYTFGPADWGTTKGKCCAPTALPSYSMSRCSCPTFSWSRNWCCRGTSRFPSTPPRIFTCILVATQPSTTANHGLMFFAYLVGCSIRNSWRSIYIFGSMLWRGDLSVGHAL